MVHALKSMLRKVRPKKSYFLSAWDYILHFSLMVPKKEITISGNTFQATVKHRSKNSSIKILYKRVKLRKILKQEKLLKSTKRTDPKLDKIKFKTSQKSLDQIRIKIRVTEPKVNQIEIKKEIKK
jgi:hypothetical protein